MSTPADCTIDDRTSELGPASPSSSGPGGPAVNPVTGLSTDYLNHFTEVVMVLEMASSMPECLDDLRAWRPKTYVEHFAGSRFTSRDAIVNAYQAADPAVRQRLDVASEELNAAILRARDLASNSIGHADAGPLQQALLQLRPLVARAAAVINGTRTDELQPDGSQLAIDAMFAG